MTSRREFLRQSAGSAAGLSLGISGTAPAAMGLGSTSPSAGFLDLHRAPDYVAAQTAAGVQGLVADAGGQWHGSGMQVATLVESHGLRVALAAPSTAVTRVHLRWRGRLDATRLVLGDAWERGYGDLEWRGLVPDRPLPWYVGLWDGTRTHAYGVRTRPAAFCWWQVDSEGISLFADVRSGGVGVQLGERVLGICTVTCRAGHADESSFAALHAFCQQLCADPRLPHDVVYGSNDWYYAYGANSATTFVGDAHRIVDLAPSGGSRPFAVADDGWQPERGSDAQGGKAAVGLWDRGNEKFPDMPNVVAQVRAAGARPGIWVRPLLAPVDAPASWRLPRDHTVLDPTVPAVRDKVAADIGRLRGWGFDLIKHDFTTYDLLGRWGFQMGAAVTADGWTFAEGATRTTAEVISDLYAKIRTAAADVLVLGCNTVSHLAAGVFELARVGDDTSGREWARTRKMGVNTLAFRAVQHGAFYAADADCVGVTGAIPWAENRQWLDLVARSGTPLFVSLAPDALGAEQRRDLRAALALAARPQPLGEPLDWQRMIWPTRWRLRGEARTYDWIGADGVLPTA